MAGRQSDLGKRGKTPSTAEAVPLPQTRQAAGGGKRRELTCVSFVVFPDGRTAPVGQLTEEERAQWHRSMKERLSEAMSDYYTQHPEEFLRL